VTPERWQRVKELFRAALELEPAARAAFLEGACAEDPGLRSEVETLIAAHESDDEDSFLERPAVELEAPSLAGATDELAAGQRVGRYEVTGRLGAGGMGEVYLARDLDDDRTVALKLLPAAFSADRDRVRRFAREARAASALDHPNVCVVYEVGAAEDGRHFIAMEHVEGETLRARLAAGPLGVEPAVDVARQVAEALRAAHDAGIVHRDVKPENVMLRSDGRVKVLDFGLAKITRQAALDLTSATTVLRTREGMVMGTAGYMSPEQARGLDVDARTDVWSLGVILYEMLTGRPPFEGETPTDVIAAVIAREPAPLEQFVSSVPEVLAAVVARALRKRVEERYQAVRELARDLEETEQELAFARWDGRTHEASPHGPAVTTAPRFVTAGTVVVRPTDAAGGETPPVGRRREVREAATALLREQVRILTLTGEAGVGKSRLALEVARAAGGQFPGGVAFVALGAAEGDEALPAIARALGVEGAGDEPLARRLAGALSGGPALLVLDGYDGVADSAPEVTGLLAAVPGTKALVTAREPLGVDGELAYPVPPLGPPDQGRPLLPGDLGLYPAAKLFAERAREADASFEVTRDNAAAVGDVCRLLGGLPLAIELAAARAGSLAPGELLEQLERRPPVPGEGALGEATRRLSLRDVVAWSVDLLEEPERRLLERLAVFAGGCTMEAAEAVCAGPGDLEVEVLDAAESLADAALLRHREQADGETRLLMPAAVREYALERLAGRPEAGEVRRLHARLFLELARTAAAQAVGGADAAWRERVEPERDNLRAALRWLLEHEPGAGAEMAAALERL
jgi:non-specific serine/threonine protein kinase